MHVSSTRKTKNVEGGFKGGGWNKLANFAGQKKLELPSNSTGYRFPLSTETFFFLPSFNYDIRVYDWPSPGWDIDHLGTPTLTTKNTFFEKNVFYFLFFFFWKKMLVWSDLEIHVQRPKVSTGIFNLEKKGSAGFGIFWMSLWQRIEAALVAGVLNLVHIYWLLEQRVAWGRKASEWPPGICFGHSV